MPILSRILPLAVLLASSLSQAVTLEILHTNDLHSRFRPDKSAQRLGGLGRIATALKRARAANPVSVTLDGGDWSEGGIYYQLGAGAESIRLMDRLGYDAAVIGNHDWINGPDTLLDAIGAVKPSMKLVSSNLNAVPYARAGELGEKILPVAWFDKGGIKVAVIGVSTYEKIYDKYFEPVKLEEPYFEVRKLSKQARDAGADVVIALSHNSIRTNRTLLWVAPELDLVVGAHDHVKLTEPERVKRLGRPEGWVVETGAWGKYLGHVRLEVEPGPGKRPKLVDYRLEQMDARVPEDAEVVAEIDRMDARVLAQRDSGFLNRPVAQSTIHVDRTAGQQLMGCLTADAYLRAANGRASFALENIGFVYGEIHPGALTMADFFDANPAVFNPKTQKAWTVKLLPILGSKLRSLFTMIYTSGKLGETASISASGLEVAYDAVVGASEVGSGAETQRVIESMKVGGVEVKGDQTYWMAGGEGIIESLRFLNSIKGGWVPLEGLVDTGVEGWQALADHVSRLSPLTLEKVPLYGRIHSTHADRGVLAQDLSLEPVGPKHETLLRAKLRGRVHNFGGEPAVKGTKLLIRLLAGGTDRSTSVVETDLARVALAQDIPAQSALPWEAEVALPVGRGGWALEVLLEGSNAQDPIRRNGSAVEVWLESGLQSASAK